MGDNLLSQAGLLVLAESDGSPNDDDFFAAAPFASRTADSVRPDLWTLGGGYSLSSRVFSCIDRLE